MDNMFKSIEEGPRGSAFIPSCELAYRFMKIERANAKSELEKFLDKKSLEFDEKKNYIGLDEVIKNGFNWHIIDFIYELGAIKYLIDHNEILNDPDDEHFMTLKTRFLRALDNGQNEKEAKETCLSELSYFSHITTEISKDREGLGKQGLDIANKGRHGIYHYLIKKPKDEYSLKLIVKEFKKWKKINEKTFRDLGSGFEEMNDYFLRFPHLIEWTSPTNERTEPKPHNTSTVWIALKLSPNCRINKNPTGNIRRPITDIVYILLFYIFSFVISLINLFTNCSKL